MTEVARSSTLPLLKALLRRLGWGVLTLWLVSLVTFALLFVVPRWTVKHEAKKDAKTAAKANSNEAAELIAAAIGGEHLTPEVIQNIIRERGLDKPLVVQYVYFLRDALTNNLKSYQNDERVFSAIVRRFPFSLALALLALAIYLGAAIPIGLYTSTRAGRFADRFALVLSLVAISIPTFWLGRLFQHYLGYKLGWFSVGGSGDWLNMLLPALTLGVGGAAYYARLLHSNLRGVLHQDYIRAARARGIGSRSVLWKHALKNAMIPVIAILGLDFASLLSGLIFTEKIFAWPGIGSLAVDAVIGRNVPMIMGTVLFSALMVVVANILVDFAYHIIDPRVRFE